MVNHSIPSVTLELSQSSNASIMKLKKVKKVKKVKVKDSTRHSSTTGNYAKRNIFGLSLVVLASRPK